MGVKWANQGFKVSGLIFPSQYEFDCLNHIDETFRELILIGRDTCTKVDPLDYFCSSKICWLLHQTKTNPLYSIGMELKTKKTSLKYEKPIPLIIKTDHIFVRLRFQTFV